MLYDDNRLKDNATFNFRCPDVPEHGLLNLLHLGLQ